MPGRKNHPRTRSGLSLGGPVTGRDVDVWRLRTQDRSQRQAGSCIWLADPLRFRIYDAWGGDDAPRDEIGVKISESAFHCNGDFCKTTCSSFEVVAQRMYEFVGTLQINEISELVLENIDLDQSSQLVDGKWVSIQKGNFDVMFP